MKPLNISLLFLLALTSTGCQVIASIFTAGIWLGIFAVVVVVLIIWLIFGAAA